MTDDGVRVDKWLHVARVFKTRTQATRACALGRVEVNGARAKAHRRLALSDIVVVDFHDWQRVLEVRELRDRPLPKAEAGRLFDDRSPAQPQVDPLARFLRRPPAVREQGSGRPTKRERRLTDRWRQR